MRRAIEDGNIQRVENMIKRDGIDVNAAIIVSTITTSCTSTCYY